MYDSRLKEAAIKKIEQGMSATSISRELNIPRQTIQYWSKNCGSAPTTAYTRRKDYSLEKKLEIIKKEKAGANSVYADALKKRKILENLKEKSLN